MFLGDFSAGCAYLTRADKKKIRLFTSSKFHWLIGDKMDTTVTDETSCAYDRFVCGSLTKEGKTKIKCSERERIEWREADNGVDQRESLNVIFQCILFGTLCARIVVHGKSFLKAIIPFSAKVFNVGKEFKITKSKVCASVFFCLFKSCNNIYGNEMSVFELSEPRPRWRAHWRVTGFHWPRVSRV